MTLAAVLWMTACHTPHRPPPAASASAASGVTTVGNAPLWSVDPQQSSLVLLVYRDGPMAALGHNHVIVLRGVQGELQRADALAASRIQLRIALDRIDIDDPARRAALGPDFSAAVSDAARAGTRRNMLGEQLLDAAHYPFIDVSAVGAETVACAEVAPGRACYRVRARLRVRDRESERLLTASVSERQEGLYVEGHMTLRQSELGLTPFSVFLGALRVADEMQVSFSLLIRPPEYATAPH